MPMGAFLFCNFYFKENLPCYALVYFYSPTSPSWSWQVSPFSS
ncbi:hypothetical protein [Moraxella lacunata]